MNRKAHDEFIFPFEKLDIWKLAVELADYVLNSLDEFPKGRYFRLVSQMESAVCSVAQNIAEGKGRQYKKEFIQFLYIAEGSLFEVLTLVEILRRRDLIKDNDVINIKQLAETIDRKLHGLINSLKKRL